VQIKELGHIVLFVRNLEKSTSFYRDVLGWEQIVGAEGALKFRASAFRAPTNRTHHELLLIEVGADAADLPAGRRIGMYHFGLKIGDSDDELRNALEELGKTNTTIVGTSDHTITHSIYIEDPDGNEIELYIDVPGVDWVSDPSLIASPIKPLRL
jgi:catechol 2,3-dioxygenase